MASVVVRASASISDTLSGMKNEPNELTSSVMSDGSAFQSGLHALFAPLALECDARLRAIVAAQSALLDALASVEASLPADETLVSDADERRVLLATRTLLGAAARVSAVRTRIDAIAARCSALESATLGDPSALTRLAWLPPTVVAVTAESQQLVQPVVSHAIDKGRSVLSGIVTSASAVGGTAVRLTKAGAANAVAVVAGGVTAVSQAASAAAAAAASANSATSASATSTAASSSPSSSSPSSSSSLPLLAFDSSSGTWSSTVRSEGDAVPEQRERWTVAQIDGATVVGDEPLQPRDADFVVVWCEQQTPISVLARLQQVEWCRAFLLVQHTMFCIVMLRHRPLAVRVASRALVVQTDASFAFVLTSFVPGDEWRQEMRSQVPNAIVCWPVHSDAPAGQEAFGDALPSFHVVE
jgi:hypothetical protein